VVAVVDAKHIGAHLSGTGLLSRSVEAGRQVAFADLVLVNKADVASEEELTRAERAIRDINPTAGMQRTEYCDVDPATLLSRGAWDTLHPHMASMMCGAAGVGADGSAAAPAGMHSAGLTTVTLSDMLQTVAVSPVALQAWLQAVVSVHHEALYRIKGLLRVHGEAEDEWTWFVVHGVHGDVQGSAVDLDLDEDGGDVHNDTAAGGRRAGTTAAIVLIGRSLPAAALRRSFAAQVLATAAAIADDDGSVSPAGTGTGMGTSRPGPGRSGGGSRTSHGGGTGGAGDGSGGEEAEGDHVHGPHCRHGHGHGHAVVAAGVGVGVGVGGVGRGSGVARRRRTVTLG